MPGITPLTKDSFYVTRPPNRKGVLNLRLPGEVLVLFMAQSCHWCKLYLPKFAQLAASPEWGRVKFATIDLGAERAVVDQSRGTSTEINAVPTQILYINGRPHARFKGEYSLPNVSNFLGKALAMYAGGRGGAPAHAAGAPRQFHNPHAAPHAAPHAGQPPAQHGPQPGQAGSLYGGPAYNGSQPSYAPELSGPPALARRMQGAPASQYNFLGDPDAEDENTLLVGGDIRPHNQPWTGEFKTLG